MYLAGITSSQQCACFNNLFVSSPRCEPETLVAVTSVEFGRCCNGCGCDENILDCHTNVFCSAVFSCGVSEHLDVPIDSGINEALSNQIDFYVLCNVSTLRPPQVTGFVKVNCACLSTSWTWLTVTSHVITTSKEYIFLICKKRVNKCDTAARAQSVNNVTECTCI